MNTGGNFLGMDTAAIRTLAQQMDAGAEQIQAIMNRLTQQLQHADWRGNDANKFRNEWQSQHCRGLNVVVNSLKHAAVLSRQNAAEQDQASA